MQKDVVLRIPRCSAMEILACEDPLSEAPLKTATATGIEDTGKLVCDIAVPGGCPRIRCNKEEKGYQACRMIALIQSQENESGFWMKLPCSLCPEKRDLHPVTEAFVYGEDENTASSI